MWVASRGASTVAHSVARSAVRWVASTDETTAVTMDEYWADQTAASTDALRVGQKDASTVADSAARSAVRWAASTDVM